MLTDVGGKKDCVPTAVAILTYNLGYGYGSSLFARRAATYAHLANPHHRRKTKRAYPCFIGTATKLQDGFYENETCSLLDSYGYQYSAYTSTSYDLSGQERLGQHAQSVTPEGLIDLINNLEDGDGAIINGVHPGGGGHGIAILRKKHVTVALDRIEDNICWAHVGISQKIARLDNDGEIEIRGAPPGQRKKSHKEAKLSGLESIRSVFIIKKQSLAQMYWNAALNSVSRMGEYVGRVSFAQSNQTNTVKKQIRTEKAEEETQAPLLFFQKTSNERLAYVKEPLALSNSPLEE
ncbi:hypothetical protein [Piscirickettsia litoralis]|uniref:Uncharacterized protein n=1 Tax=Piscirickettsia litoralis TaxID=1891921 RepID=A0ABX3A5I1_9GAMM|nr:hypothetical protein [Piscirickettsia litoralis]ODN43683.1 hypothetical protein BGC07_13200 [Piscirickettsia litoralis]